MTDFTAFQIIQYDFIVAPAIYYIRLKLYMNVLCCSHLQIALKHIVCFVLQIQISAILGGERPQARTILYISGNTTENTPSETQGSCGAAL